MAVFLRTSILQLVIFTLVLTLSPVASRLCFFGSNLCDETEEYTFVGPNGTIYPSATPVASARSDIECSLACSENVTCKSFGYATPFVAGSCLVSEWDNCTLTPEGKTYRKDCKFSPTGPMTTGTTIMFLQRHIGDVNFTKPWVDYDNGFGNCNNGDFWLGLRNIKTLLGSASAMWRVDMKLWTGESIFVEYNGFTVGASSTNYLMSYTGMGFRSPMITAASVDTNAEFSTMDRDNDKHLNSCGQMYNANGGFWFNSCGSVFPTATFPSAPNPSFNFMIWYTGSSYVSLREIPMYLKR